MTPVHAVRLFKLLATGVSVGFGLRQTVGGGTDILFMLYSCLLNSLSLLLNCYYHIALILVCNNPVFFQ